MGSPSLLPMNWSVKDVMIQSWEEQGTAKVSLFAKQPDLARDLRIREVNRLANDRPADSHTHSMRFDAMRHTGQQIPQELRTEF